MVEIIQQRNTKTQQQNLYEYEEEEEESEMLSLDTYFVS